MYGSGRSQLCLGFYRYIIRLYQLAISCVLSDRQTGVLSHGGQLQSIATLNNNGRLAAYAEA